MANQNELKDGTEEWKLKSQLFKDLTDDQVEAHMNIALYGNFVLTDAVRPAYDLEVVPRSGFRHYVYEDRQSSDRVPVVMASASRETILDLFIDLLDPLGETVDVVLESSHHRTDRSHLDLFRRQIDLPILKSILYDFEDLLLNDGCCGIAVLNPRMPMEVQFDDHKLITVFGYDLSSSENTLADHSIDCDEELRFITDAEHVHVLSDECEGLFNELVLRLGVCPGG